MATYDSKFTIYTQTDEFAHDAITGTASPYSVTLTKTPCDGVTRIYHSGLDEYGSMSSLNKNSGLLTFTTPSDTWESTAGTIYVDYVYADNTYNLPMPLTDKMEVAVHFVRAFLSSYNAIKTIVSNALVHVTEYLTVFSAVTLTNDFADNEAEGINVKDWVHGEMHVRYVMGTSETGNHLQIKIEKNYDGGSTYFQETYKNEAGAYTDLIKKVIKYAAESAAGTYDNIVYEMDLRGVSYLKLSAKEMGVNTNYGTLYIYLNKKN